MSQPAVPKTASQTLEELWTVYARPACKRDQGYKQSWYEFAATHISEARLSALLRESTQSRALAAIDVFYMQQGRRYPPTRAHKDAIGRLTWAVVKTCAHQAPLRPLIRFYQTTTRLSMR